MFQSIKVDVIYFATANDFEMEFNLGGCCRMRLLTDKAVDRKTFIHSLSRAVSRSRVIICCGPLFSDGGLIRGVSAAIGQPLETADLATYGIQGNMPIQIIQGSIPLVTDDGIFGGCVIESGPQSIILLTESKSVRKSLMNSLIHPYIEALSQKEIAAKIAATRSPLESVKASVNAPVEISPVLPVEEAAVDIADSTPVEAEETENPEAAAPVIELPEESETPSAEETESAEDNAESPLEETVSEEPAESPAEEVAAEAENQPEENNTPEAPAEIPEEIEDIAENEPDESDSETPAADFEKKDIELFFDAEDVIFNKKKYYDMYYEAENQLVGVTDENPPITNPRKPLRILLIILVILLLLGLAFLAYTLLYLPLRRGIPIGQHFNDLFTAVRRLRG